MDDVVKAFEDQVETVLRRMIDDFGYIERGNRDFHPTPYSSRPGGGVHRAGAWT